MDPVLAGKTAEFLQTSGPWGLIVVCFGVIIFLWRDSVTLRKQISDLHEKRTGEVAALAEKTATGLANSSTSIGAQAVATNATNALLQQVLDMVRLWPATSEALSRQIVENGSKTDRLFDHLIRGERGDR